MTVSFYRYRRPARTLTRPTAPERPPVIRRPAAGTIRYRPPAPPPTTVSISRVWWEGEGHQEAGGWDNPLQTTSAATDHSQYQPGLVGGGGGISRPGQPAADHQRRHRPQSVSAGSGGRGRGHQQAGTIRYRPPAPPPTTVSISRVWWEGEGASAGRDNPLQTTSAATDHSQYQPGLVGGGGGISRPGQSATDHQRRHRPQSVSAGSGGRGRGHQQAGTIRYRPPAPPPTTVSY